MLGWRLSKIGYVMSIWLAVLHSRIQVACLTPQIPQEAGRLARVGRAAVVPYFNVVVMIEVKMVEHL